MSTAEVINLDSQGKHQTSGFQILKSLQRMEETLFLLSVGLGVCAFMFPSVILWSALGSALAAEK